MHTQKILQLLDLLEAQYHNEARPPELGHAEPLDGLILTVLSQNTNDKNRDAAFRLLKAKFPEWEDVVSAGALELERVIRSAGLAHTKASRILTILEIVHSDFGSYSIKRLPVEIMKQYLRALPGVGAKTAACVMLFEFGVKAFPVDTHVSRVAKRTGIAGTKDTPEEISVMLEGVVPLERCLGGHVNMIAHGRTVCHSQRPECEECVLSGMCARNL